jgi:myo-inositol 2-dehydrogenase/D-chiro-inositol 1-dehydrogenase
LKTYNICMVGSGYMARKHSDLLKSEPRAKLKTLVSSGSSKNSESFKSEYDFENVYGDLGEALGREEIDIVYIISPNSLHQKQVSISLESGRHVFCEKPLCYTGREFKLIETSLSKSGKVLQVGMNCRYREQFSIPKQMIVDGALGDIRYVKGTYIFNLIDAIKDKPWWLDFPNGIFPFLHSGAIHSLDLIRWFGGSAQRVSAAGSGFELKNEWVKDNFASVIEFDNGIIGEFIGSATANRPPDFSIEIWGSKGSIINCNHLYYEAGKLVSKQIEVKQEKIDLLMQFDDLIDSIENNKHPMNSFSEAYENYELITAIENSVKQNKTINLN